MKSSAPQTPRDISRAEARALLESLRGRAFAWGGSDNWITHALAVGDTAAKLGTGLGLDRDFAATLGYLHDIGRGLGPDDHILAGYRYLRDQGYADKYCNICLTHSFLGPTPEFLSGDRLEDPFLAQFLRTHRPTVYEKLITLCDLLCLDRPRRLEERLIDVLRRYGTSERTQTLLDAVFALKTDFESQLGCSIYDLIDCSNS